MGSFRRCVKLVKSIQTFLSKRILKQFKLSSSTEFLLHSFSIALQLLLAVNCELIILIFGGPVGSK